MGSLFRSQHMSMCQLYLPVEAAHDTIDELGKRGLIEFRDMNPDVNAFQRKFVANVKQLDEMDRRLGSLHDEIEKEKISEAETHAVLAQEAPQEFARLDDLDQFLVELEADVMVLRTEKDKLSNGVNELIEFRAVLEKDEDFFAQDSRAAAQMEPGAGGGGGGVGGSIEDGLEARSLLAGGAGGGVVDGGLGAARAAVRLAYLTGVIPSDRIFDFDRLMWRSLHYNAYWRHARIEQPLRDPTSPPGEDRLIEKHAFVIFFQGERMGQKIRKLCESFQATIYDCPDSAEARRARLAGIDTNLEQIRNVLAATVAKRRTQLTKVSAQWQAWKERVVKEKGIYDVLNMFDFDTGRRILIGEGWCPADATRQIQEAMEIGSQRSGAGTRPILSTVAARETPPTYFVTNKFTQAFQDVVDAYGMARYREVNPAVFTIVTFPLLFGIMFGDIGHGLMLTLVAAYFVLAEKKLSQMKLNQMVKMLFGGRYLLLLMGLASIYMGLLYNECFSVPLDIFGSRWKPPPDQAANSSYDNSYDYYTEEHSRWLSVYPFGVDPAWKGAKNELLFYNSVKMKMSVIIGVSQMVLGICIQLLNGITLRKPYDIFFVFAPQLVFMLCLFGYMDFLIFFKWFRPGPAPLLLNTMINMFLKPLPFMLDDPKQDLLYGDIQAYIQVGLVLVAVAMVPIMLFPKPLLLWLDHRRGKAVETHGEEEFQFGEIFVHQVIHTIEYVLGTVSNTASYLRLWALSLAHSELSTVFWEMILVLTMTVGLKLPYVGFIVVFIGFAIWAALTIGVLMVMESLSAFLHTLRLHWVEFQNKFFAGDGRRFMPFSYEALLASDDE